MGYKAPKRERKGGAPFFIKTVKIVSATDHGPGNLSTLLDGNPAFGKANFNVEVCFEVQYDTGHDFNRSIVMFGKKFVDAHGDPENKGAYFTLFQLAEATEYWEEVLDDDLNVTQGFLSHLAGQKVQIIEYAAYLRKNGKIGYEAWDSIFATGDKESYIKSQFERSVERGYPKRYDPNLQEVSGDGATADPVPAQTAPAPF